MDQNFVLRKRKDQFEVEAQIFLLGKDVLVILQGGAFHIGAVGMAQPRPSLADPEKIGATASVFTFPGHKEDDLSKSMAEGLSRKLNRRIVVVAGIHWDSLKREEIKIITGLCKKMGEQISSEISKRTKSG
jgi:gallate decarboxylase subunit D